MPFSVHHTVDHPLSLYAASKKANELMAHTYSHLYRVPTTGLRFFTVYGPWGRPDMALFIFAKAIQNGKSIDLFNNGEMIRDFTYIDDVVEAIIRIKEKSIEHYYINSNIPYKIFNVGNNKPIPIIQYLNELETAIGKKAKINYKSIQLGDVPRTEADNEELFKWINFKPKTTVKYGVDKFAEWYKKYDQSNIK
jgi:UDP-glucuronate 4-epimerase